MGTAALKLAEKRLLELARLISAPRELLPTLGHTVDGAHPHIEHDENGYHYVIVERGMELARVTSHNLDEILRHAFLAITHEMAASYECRNRRPNEDSRRQLFAKQRELIAQVNPDWAEVVLSYFGKITPIVDYDDDGTSQ